MERTKSDAVLCRFCCCLCFLFVFVHNIVNAYFMGARHSWKPQVFCAVAFAVVFSVFFFSACVNPICPKNILCSSLLVATLFIRALSGIFILVTPKPPANHFSLWNFRFTSFYITGISLDLAFFSIFGFFCGRWFSSLFFTLFTFNVSKKCKGCFCCC